MSTRVGEHVACRAHTPAASPLGLRQFPIDILKIDRSFIVGIDGDVGKAKLVRGIVNLGRSLHLEVIVEGIERPEQAGELRSMGVRLAQGVLYSRPVSGESMRAALVRGTVAEGGKAAV